MRSSLCSQGKPVSSRCFTDYTPSSSAISFHQKKERENTNRVFPHICSSSPSSGKKIIFAEMDSHRDSIDSVFSSKLESAGSSWKSSDALLESGGASDHGFLISKLRSCPVVSRQFLMGWIFATAIHICIVLFALMFVNLVRLDPEDRTCSAKLSTYCESTQSLDIS